jgi:type I restriction enzyme S subunit
MENGKIALASGLRNGIACGSTEFHVLHANSSVLPAYLWRFLRQDSFREEAQQQMTGVVGQRRVPMQFLKQSTIPLPPLAEQARIVAKADNLLARSKNAREELVRIPRLVERYKQAVLAAAFRGDLTAEWRKEQGLAEPKSATVDTLVSVPIRNGLSVRGSDSPPGVRSLRLSALRSGVVDLSDVRFLPITSGKAEKFLLRDGDVLVSRGNGTKSFVGIAALVRAVDEPTIFPDTAFRIRLAKDRVRPDWFTSMWNSPQVRTQIEGAAKTTAGIWKVSQGDLARIKLFLPDPKEQEEIACRLKSAFTHIEKTAAEAARATRLLDRLDQAVLAKAFRGELVSPV